MGNKTKRKTRKEVKTDYFEPIDITQIGTEDDPCFGKLYDLSTNECKSCGDNARCAIVMGQGQLLHKSKLEKKNRFKDIEAAEKDTILKYMKKKKAKGLKRIRIIKLCKKRFTLDSKTYRQLYKTLD